MKKDKGLSILLFFVFMGIAFQSYSQLIDNQPPNDAICKNQDAQFTVIAVTGFNGTYLWQYSADRTEIEVSDSVDIDNTLLPVVSPPSYIAVNPLVDCTITGPDLVCAGSTNVYSGTGGMVSYTWSISGGAIAGSTTTQTVNVTAGSGSTLTLTLAISDGTATNTCEKTVTINPLPVVTWSNTLTNQCVSSTIYELTGGSPSGGSYSGPGVTGTNFDASAAGVGIYTLAYSYTDGIGCINSATNTITVFDLPVVTWSNTLTNQCVSSTAYTLTGGTPGGGSYSGLGITGTTFNPSLAGVGTHTLTYTYTDGNGCTNSGTNTITVYGLPTITPGSNPAVCSGITSANLTYTTMTGSPDQYSVDYDPIAVGQGFVDIVNASLGSSSIALIVPEAATPATYNGILTVRNSYTGCFSNNYAITITVYPIPYLTSSLTPPPFCSNSPFTYVPESSVSETSFSWTRAVVQGISNGAGSGTGNINETLFNTTSDPISVTYVYTLAAGDCHNPTTFDVDVIINPTPAFSMDGPDNLCANSHQVAYDITYDTEYDYQYKWTVINGIKTYESKDTCIVDWNDDPGGTGTVTYKATDKTSQCQEEKDVTVIFSSNSSPELDDIVAKPKQGSPVVLICQNPGYNYQWYKGDELIAGATGQFYYAGTGNYILPDVTYMVLVTDKTTGCANLSPEFIYYLEDKSLLFNPDDLFMVYPNPSSGYLIVRLNEIKITEDESCEIHITDLTGKVVMENKVFSIENYIDASRLGKGIYFIEINTDDDRQFKKIILY